MPNYEKTVVTYLGNMAHPSTTCIFNIPQINKVQQKRPHSALPRYTNDIAVHEDITITEHKSGLTNSINNFIVIKVCVPWQGLYLIAELFFDIDSISIQSFDSHMFLWRKNP
jgi:hypothetical protein